MFVALNTINAATATQGSSDVHRDATLPTWVKPYPVEMDAPGPESASASDVYYLLADRQTHAEEETRFAHFAYRLTSESAVQDYAQLTFDFDPAHEVFTLHRLRVTRSGNPVDRLDTQKVQVLQRETGAERQLYDGTLSAVMVLDDIRVGDIVEYAYSVKGSNPVFEGHFSHFAMTRWSMPIHQARMRTLWKKERPVAMKNQGNPVAPTLSEENGMMIATLEEDQIRPILADDSVPASHPTHPWIEFSDYASWNAVARWADAQYALDQPLPDDLKTVVERLHQLPNDEAVILTALRWVQDEIRYVGFFDGIHSHRPHPIDEVCRSRFGDCKDKSTVLVRLLQTVGIDAQLALVATRSRQAINDWLPTPDSFDHVVVCVSLNGKRHWLDGTRSFQRGRLEDLFFPDYGYALLVSENSTELTPIIPSGFNASRMEVIETLDIEDYKGTAKFSVVSTYYGAQAESLRSYFASTSRESIEKDYLNHYSRDFPNIEVIKSLTFEDNQQINVATTIESYLVKDLWFASKGNDAQIEMETYARMVAGELSTPSSRIRTMPFAISHPKDVTQRIILNFPTPINLTDEFTKVSNPAFEFSLKEIASPQRLELVYHYRSLDDQVAAKDMPAYLKAVDDAENVLVYGITVPTTYQTTTVEEIRASLNEEAPFRPIWILFVVAALTLLLSTAVSIALYFWNPSPRRPPDHWHSDLIGLGGWLILVAINVLLIPVVRGGIGLQELLDWDQSLWIAATHPDYEAYHVMWEPSLLASVVVTWSMVPFGILMIVLFFHRRTSFPILAIGRLIFDLVTSAILLAMFLQIDALDDEFRSALHRSLFQVIIASLVWIPYFSVSKRVKLTFIRRRGRTAVPVPPPLPTRPPSTADAWRPQLPGARE